MMELIGCCSIPKWIANKPVLLHSLCILMPNFILSSKEKGSVECVHNRGPHP